MHFRYPIAESPLAAGRGQHVVSRLPPPPAVSSSRQQQQRAASPFPRHPYDAQETRSPLPEALPRPASMSLAEMASHRAEVAAREAGSVAHRLTTRGTAQDDAMEPDNSMALSLMPETVAPDMTQGPGGPGGPNMRRLQADMGRPPSLRSDHRKVKSRGIALPPAPEEMFAADAYSERGLSERSYTELPLTRLALGSSTTNSMRSLRQELTPQRHAVSVESPVYWDDRGSWVPSPSHARLPVAPISPGESHHMWCNRVLQSVEAPTHTTVRSLPVAPFKHTNSTSSSSRDKQFRFSQPQNHRSESVVGRLPVAPSANEVASSWRWSGGAVSNTIAHAPPQTAMEAEVLAQKREFSLSNLQPGMMYPERRLDGQRPVSPMSMRLVAERRGRTVSPGRAVSPMSPHALHRDPDENLVGRAVSPSAKAPMRPVHLGRPPRAASPHKDMRHPEPIASQQFRPAQRVRAPSAPSDSQLMRAQSVGPPISSAASAGAAYSATRGASRNGVAFGDVAHRTVHWSTRLASSMPHTPLA